MSTNTPSNVVARAAYGIVSTATANGTDPVKLFQHTSTYLHNNVPRHDGSQAIPSNTVTMGLTSKRSLYPASLGCCQRAGCTEAVGSCSRETHTRSAGEHTTFIPDSQARDMAA
jgi:hypothetical protein